VRFPAATVVKLERNYRSRQPILELANAARPDVPKRGCISTACAAADSGRCW
jgi:superfamily I DNA/RNA helicase